MTMLDEPPVGDPPDDDWEDLLNEALPHDGARYQNFDYTAVLGTDLPKANGKTPHAEPSARPAPHTVLPVLTLAQLAHEVDNEPPVEWLARGVLAGDTYGVLAAPPKAGKTWIGLDLAVAVASAGAWLGRWQCDRPGPVLVCLGEGGKRKMLRRLRAVAAAHGCTAELLDVHVMLRVPHLNNQEHLDALEDHIAAIRPVLVIIDPAYLSLAGAKTGILSEMGGLLGRAQERAQAAGAALLVIHHWNKTGEGRGAHRFTGAGLAEWGRILISVDVLTSHTDTTTKASDVLLHFDITGDETPESAYRVRRRISPIGDPDDMHSPLSYTVSVHDEEEPMDRRSDPRLEGLKPAAIRVLSVITAAGGWIDRRAIGDAMADEGFPLKTRTINEATADLIERSLVARRVDPAEPGRFGTTWYRDASLSDEPEEEEL